MYKADDNCGIGFMVILIDYIEWRDNQFSCIGEAPSNLGRKILGASFGKLFEELNGIKNGISYTW